MSRKNFNQIAPLISIFIILFSLFALVFLQMEVRRLGYVVLKQTREYKNLKDEQRMKVMRLAKITRPDRLRDLAVSTLTLSEAKSEQIIHMSGEKIALRP